MPSHILRIDASMRRTASTTRTLSDALIAKLAPAQVTTRDLANGLPLIDEDWITANFTPEQDRSPAQAETLALSDSLIAEIDAADSLVIGLPIYNFSIPGALKAWIDQIARAGKTFRYTADGPIGLLSNKKTYLVLASGGVPKGSTTDFATTYMTHALSFIGITDVEVIDATGQAKDPEAAQARATHQIAAIPPDLRLSA